MAKVSSRRKSLVPESATKASHVKKADPKRLLRTVSFKDDRYFEFLPISKVNMFGLLYLTFTAVCAYFGWFEHPLFLLTFVVFLTVFIAPVFPTCLLPAGTGSSQLTIPKRRSRFCMVTVADPPVEGSKPLNFQYSASWIEYKIAGLVAPSLYEIGVTPNMITLFNVAYRMWFLHYVIMNPREILVNFLYFWSSQMLDCLDGLMARRYNMGSEFGAWLDVTLDDVFAVCLVATMIFFYCRQPLVLVGIFSIGVVLVPMSSKAYIDCMRKNHRHRKKIGPGGNRVFNFFEFLGCWLEEYMALVLLLVVFMLSYADEQNYWYDPTKPVFFDELQHNVTDVTVAVAQHVGLPTWRWVSRNTPVFY